MLFEKKISKMYFLIILFMFLPKNFSYSKPLQLDSLKKYAKTVSLGLETPGSSASGFIIGKKGNNYFFITAGHAVLSDPKIEEYWVYSLEYPKKKYRVTSFEKPLEFLGKDIVIGSFYATEQFDISIIFPLGEKLSYKINRCKPKTDICLEPTFRTHQIYEVFHNKRFDKTWKIQGDPIVAGITSPSKSITVPFFRTSLLKMQERAFKNQGGYEAIYSVNSTTIGMSGSGIFGTRVCPVNLGYDSMYNNQFKLGNYLYSESPSSSGILPNPPKEEENTSMLNDSTLRMIAPRSAVIDYFQSENRRKENYKLQMWWHEREVNRTKEYPGVIAMHGMSEEYGQSGSRSGIGLGIPLDLFTEFFRNNSKKYGIPDEKEYFKLVYKFCF